MAIISTLQLLACVCICCCASCGAAILGEGAYELYVNKHSKHVMGNHMHEFVHKHNPLAKAGPAPKQGKEGVKKYGAAETASAPAAAAPESTPAASPAAPPPATPAAPADAAAAPSS